MAYVEYVCDTETTGLNPELHDVIEVCFWRLGDAESKTWCLSPLRPENITDEALKINNHSKDDILHRTASGKETYKHPSVVLPEIEMWLMEDGAAAEERVFIGQNPEFDYKFLLKLWELQGNSDNFPFGYWMEGREGRRNQGYIVDTVQLARLIDVLTGKKRARYNLGSLVKNFDITKATAHRADGDVKMTKELYEKIKTVLKDPVIAAFNDCY
ncbi:MAG: 3'-5' exonuclease [Clostridia bacterium]|jgi:DNA polymerase III alpha subunit (gram-positive type)